MTLPRDVQSHGPCMAARDHGLHGVLAAVVARHPEMRGLLPTSAPVEGAARAVSATLSIPSSTSCKAMHLLGIPLSKPTFGAITASTVMGVGIWLALTGLLYALRTGIDRFDAGALLLVIVWGCVCARIGIHIGQGTRHLAANMLISAALLGLYQVVWAFA